MARPDQFYPPEGSFNPYASPEAEIRLADRALGMGPPVQFSVGEVMSRSWAIY